MTEWICKQCGINGDPKREGKPCHLKVPGKYPYRPAPFKCPCEKQDPKWVLVHGAAIQEEPVTPDPCGDMKCEDCHIGGCPATSEGEIIAEDRQQRNRFKLRDLK
jgi:hypothetical protein